MTWSFRSLNRNIHCWKLRNISNSSIRFTPTSEHAKLDLAPRSRNPRYGSPINSGPLRYKPHLSTLGEIREGLPPHDSCVLAANYEVKYAMFYRGPTHAYLPPTCPSVGVAFERCMNLSLQLASMHLRFAAWSQPF